MKAPEEVAKLSVVKSSHMCLRAWKGKQQLEECVKGKEGWAEQILGKRPVPDETEEGAEGIIRPFGSLGSNRQLTKSSCHLCPHLPLGHLLQEVLQHLNKPFFLWAPLNVYFVVFYLL